MKKFPLKYNNHRDLGVGALLDKKIYGKPDSVIYLDKLPTRYLDKFGFLYFYKYKEKKDDLNWRLAIVGLLSDKEGEFEIEDSSWKKYKFNLPSMFNMSSNKYSFTDFTDIKFSEDEPMIPQLEKLKKRVLISKRKSGKNFYNDEKELIPYGD